MKDKVTIKFDVSKVVNNKGTWRPSTIDTLDVFLSIDSPIRVPLYQDKPFEKKRIGYFVNLKRGKKTVTPLRDVFLVEEADSSYKLQLQKNDDFFAITRDIAKIIFDSRKNHKPFKRQDFDRKGTSLEVEYSYHDGYGEYKRMLMEL